MGTALGVLFIVAAAATGVFVGTRPTVMDGRWIAGKLKTTLGDEGINVECDREIRVGAKGAEFACVHSRLGASQEVWYRMSRDGQLERTRAGRIQGRAGGEGEGGGEGGGEGED